MTIIPLLLCLFVASAYSLVNVTVDDQDNSTTTYEPAGAWVKSGLDDLDMGGSHMYTTDSTAVATFTFTGVAVYFMSPLWPYNVSSDLSLDNASPIRVDLRDYNQSFLPGGSETLLSHVVASFENLTNREHTLRISVHPNESLAIVDGFIYTTLDAEEIAASDNSKKTYHLSTALGIVSTLFALLLFNLWACFCHDRKSRSPRATASQQVTPIPPSNTVVLEAVEAVEAPVDALSASEQGLSKPSPGVVPKSKAKRQKRHSSGVLSKNAGIQDGSNPSIKPADSSSALTSGSLDSSMPSPPKRGPSEWNTAEARESGESAWDEGFSQPLKFRPIT